MSVPQWTDYNMLFVYGLNQLHAYCALCHFRVVDREVPLIPFVLTCNSKKKKTAYASPPQQIWKKNTLLITNFIISQTRVQMLNDHDEPSNLDFFLIAWILFKRKHLNSKSDILFPESSWPWFPHELAWNCASSTAVETITCVSTAVAVIITSLTDCSVHSSGGTGSLLYSFLQFSVWARERNIWASGHLSSCWNQGWSCYLNI